MLRRCVLSRNLKNKEAMARVGPQRHESGEEIIIRTGTVLSVTKVADTSDKM